MKKDISASKMATCLLGIGLLLSGYGCTDSNYDLSNIDTTVGIGGDSLAIPVSSTEDIKLDDILELDNSDLISTEANGDYVFKKEGDAVTPARPQIDEIVVINQQISNNDLMIDVTASHARRHKASVKHAPGATAPITVEGVVTKFSYESDRQKDVKDLLEADIDADLNISVTFSSELKRVVNSFKTMTLQMPAYMTFDNPVTTPAHAAFDGHNIVFNNVSTASGISIKAKLKKLHFGKAAAAGNKLVFDKTRQKVEIEGQVKAKVVFDDINAVSVDASKCYIRTRMTMDKITVTGAQGMFYPSIELSDLGKVTINSVPDFLTDDDVKINLYNPMIDLNIDNNMNVEGKVDGVITAYDDKGRVMATVDVPTMTVMPSTADGVNTTTRLRICKNDSYNPDNRQLVIVPSLSDLMTRIPKKLTFKADIKANSDRVSTMKLGNRTHYCIAPSYSVLAPLAFDKGAQIVYRDTLDGWHDDIDDYELTNGAYLKLTAKISNSVPANLAVTAYAIDADKKEVSQDRIMVEVRNTGKGSADGTTPVTSPMDIRIYEKTKGALKTIDGLVLKVEAAAGTGNDAIVGKTINANTQTLKVSDIVIKLYGRVVADLN